VSLWLLRGRGFRNGMKVLKKQGGLGKIEKMRRMQKQMLKQG